MSGYLLFCISEEAKALTRTALNAEPDAGLYLVESRSGPPNGERFKSRLKDNETFDTDFIGTTPQDCQKWTWERQSHDGSFYGNLLTIVDARSAKDGTILIQHYNPALPEDYEPITFGAYGVLPAETNVWYEYRVDHRQAMHVFSALTETAPDVTWPIYYGNKETFTDEHGVFDVQEAELYCMGIDPDVRESEILKRKYRDA